MERISNKVFGDKFDKYDEEGEVASLVGKCRFCRIVAKQDERHLYEVGNILLMHG